MRSELCQRLPHQQELRRCVCVCVCLSVFALSRVCMKCACKIFLSPGAILDADWLLQRHHREDAARRAAARAARVPDVPPGPGARGRLRLLRDSGVRHPAGQEAAALAPRGEACACVMR